MLEILKMIGGVLLLILYCLMYFLVPAIMILGAGYLFRTGWDAAANDTGKKRRK